MRPRVATAPLAAAGLIGGYAVALATGSRPLGGLVLAGCGLVCIAAWLRRDGRRTATLLTTAGLAAFALSHVIALIIGPWPAVLLAAASAGVLSWRLSDSRHVNLKRLSTGSRANFVICQTLGLRCRDSIVAAAIMTERRDELELIGSRPFKAGTAERSRRSSYPSRWRR